MSFSRQIKDRINGLFEGLESWQVARNTIAAAIIVFYSARFTSEAQKHGFKKTLFGYLFAIVKKVPLAQGKIDSEMKQTLQKLEKHILGDFEGANEPKYLTLPAEGVAQDKLLNMLKKWKGLEENRWKKGQVSGGIYHGGDNLVRFCSQVYSYFALSNPLHPEIFPYVRKMEAEVISMALGLFNGRPGCCGAMTSGGTESILMAMLAYRNRARARGITEPEIISADTAHAAFDKGAHYFGIKLIKVAVDDKTFKMDMKACKAALTENTIALVGSAPTFPHGIIDPIQELSDLAQEHKLGLHVDCCLGSFLMPCLEKIGYKPPGFDFRVPGVTSISADSHKYGYAPKGSSLVMFSSTELRSYQFFVAPEWPGGVYCSPTMPGSRPGGLIASTWAAMVSLGEDGYLECARGVMKAAKTIENGLRKIEGIQVLGQPDMSIIAFNADQSSAVGRKINIYMVSDAMKKRDWNLNSLQRPASIHICCTYLHREVAEKFVNDVRDSVREVLENPDLYKKGQAAIYGLAETIPDTSLTEDIAKGYLDIVLKAS
jgi:sphinganine-1-phosphate aldolase